MRRVATTECNVGKSPIQYEYRSLGVLWPFPVFENVTHLAAILKIVEKEVERVVEVDVEKEVEATSPWFLLMVYRASGSTCA